MGGIFYWEIIATKGIVMKTFESIHFFRLKYIIFISIISMLFFQLKIARAEGWTHLRTMKKEQILSADETSGIIMTAFNDENAGIACLFDKILVTYDGGRNWKPAEVPLIQYLNNIEMLDSEHAWVSASFEIRKTDTGIAKWQNLPNFGPMYESGRFSFIT
ncbi:MAG TPA: hypothetical protein PKK43_13735, partial [Spirochaetota bacterium]|nr:hypothetical protein [Spirochaetota bacterium]